MGVEQKDLIFPTYIKAREVEQEVGQSALLSPQTISLCVCVCVCVCSSIHRGTEGRQHLRTRNVCTGLIFLVMHITFGSIPLPAVQQKFSLLTAKQFASFAAAVKLGE